MRTIRSDHHQLGSYDLKKYRSAVLMIKDIFWMMKYLVMHMVTIKLTRISKKQAVIKKLISVL